MQQLNSLWHLAASTVAQDTKTHAFMVQSPTTLYMQAENAHVQIKRWARPKIEITSKLQVGFGWRVLTDQDEAGVYMVARRRGVIGGLSSARFEIHIPKETYLILKLSGCILTLNDVNSTVKIPPIDDDDTRI